MASFTVIAGDLKVPSFRGIEGRQVWGALRAGWAHLVTIFTSSVGLAGLSLAALMCPSHPVGSDASCLLLHPGTLSCPLCPHPNQEAKWVALVSF